MAQQTANSARYYGATEGELRNLSAVARLAGWLVQQRLFPHHGLILLEEERLVLGSWMEIRRPTVEQVSIEFTKDYGRWLAAGNRGTAPSFGWIGDLGKPLILHRTGDSEPIYLLIGFNWLTGINRNRSWYERLTKWAARPADTATGAGG